MFGKFGQNKSHQNINKEIISKKEIKSGTEIKKSIEKDKMTEKDMNIIKKNL